MSSIFNMVHELKIYYQIQTHTNKFQKTIIYIKFIFKVSLEKKYVKTVTGTGSQGHDMIGGKLWTEQEISSPWDVCFDKNKTILFIAMAGTHQIWGLYLADEENIFKCVEKI